jgi:hypothetical protein
LNEGSESEQPTGPVDFREYGVDIDLPSREEIEVVPKIHEKQQGSRRGFYWIGDKHFEIVKEFIYLGSLMTPTNDVSLEIQRKTRLQIGASSDYANICSRAIHARQNSPFIRP